VQPSAIRDAVSGSPLKSRRNISAKPDDFKARNFRSSEARATLNIKLSDWVRIILLPAATVENEFCSNQILKGASDRFEDRTFVGRCPTGRPTIREIEKVASDVVDPDGTVGDCLNDFSGLFGGTGPRIDKNCRARDRIVIGFAHLGRERADKIEMAAWLHPLAQNEGNTRKCCATDDVSATDFHFRIVGGLCVEAICTQGSGKLLGFAATSTPDPDPSDGSD
jgi:hypothetical protein